MRARERNACIAHNEFDLQELNFTEKHCTSSLPAAAAVDLCCLILLVPNSSSSSAAFTGAATVAADINCYTSSGWVAGKAAAAQTSQ